MRKQRLRFLIVMCMILVTIAIIGSSSWLIVHRHTEENPVNIEKTDTNPYFTSSATYDGSTKWTPQLNADGLAVFGSDAEISDFEITYLGGETANPDWNEGKFSETSTTAYKNAGKHYFKIVEKKTGQVIAEKHCLTVAPAEMIVNVAENANGFVSGVTGKKVTYVDEIGAAFVGDKIQLTIEVTKFGRTTSSTETVTVTSSSYTNFKSTFIESDGSTFSNVFNWTYAGTLTEEENNNFSITINNSGYSIGIIPTCYTMDSSGNPTAYYATVEQGIKKLGNTTATLVAATHITGTVKRNGTDVSFDYNSINHYKHKITTNTTIESKLTLWIPYNEAVTSDYEFSTLRTGHALGNSKYELNSLTIASGKTLTNKGTIKMPGVVSGGAGGTLSSYTVGNHSRIYMESSSTLQNEGTINCYGYITESLKSDGTLDEDNGSLVYNKSGTILTVFSVMENRGGATFLGMLEPNADSIGSHVHIGDEEASKNDPFKPSIKAFPMHRFYIHTITANMQVDYGATVIGYASLYANNEENKTDFIVIGNVEDSIIQLTNSGTKVYTDFDVDDLKHDIDVKGNANLNPMELTLTINKEVEKMGIKVTAYITASMNTGSTYFPISEHLDIELMPYESGLATTIDITNQDVKVLPGGSFKIHDGVTLNATNIAVYDDNSLLNGNKVQAPAYTNNTPGVFIVDGTLNVTNIGGNIQTTKAGAVLNITGSNNVKPYEVIDASEESILTITVSVGLVYTATQEYQRCVFDQYDLTANGRVKHYDGAQYIDDSELSVGTHTSLGNNTWTGYSSKRELKFEFYGVDSDGKNLAELDYSVDSSYYQQAASHMLASYDIPGYSFLGWYWDTGFGIDSAITGTSVLGTDLYNRSTADDKSITLYALYQAVNENDVKINYYVDQSVVTNTGHIIATPAQVTIDKTQYPSYTLADLATYNSDLTKMYYFDGWYLDAAYKTKIDGNAIDPNIAVDGTINVYGRWVKKLAVTVANPETYDTPNTTSGPTVTVNGQTFGKGSTFYVTSGTQISITAYCSGYLTKTGIGSLTSNTYAACSTTITAGSDTTTATATKKSGFMASANKAEAKLTHTVTADVTINVTFDGSI